MSDRKKRATAPTQFDAARLDEAGPTELLAVIARANAALPDTDPRKIRPEDVAMLQRLSEQASDVNDTMVEHAAERRKAGERRGRVSPEAGKTAQWAARLAAALESMLETPAAVPTRANGRTGLRLGHTTTGRESGSDEFLAHQRREFRAADGSRWRVRIEQGGGQEAADSGSPPVAVLIFQSADDTHAPERSAAEPGGKWDLAAYSVDELRATLARAKPAKRAR